MRPRTTYCRDAICVHPVLIISLPKQRDHAGIHALAAAITFHAAVTSDAGDTGASHSLRNDLSTGETRKTRSSGSLRQRPARQTR